MLFLVSYRYLNTSRHLGFNSVSYEELILIHITIEMIHDIQPSLQV